MVIVTGDHSLRVLWATGRAAHPELELGEDEFTAYWAKRLRGADPGSPEIGLDLRAADLFLACACAERVARATDAFRATHGRAVRATLKTLLRSAALADEVEQQVHEELLVGRGDRAPSISRYAGQGPLGRWTVVVARRAGLMALRADAVEARARDAVTESRIQESFLDQELSFIKSRYLPEIERALKDAVEKLPPRDQILLRIQVVAGAGVEKIGRMYNVNPSTVSRWMAGIRSAIARHVREWLIVRCRVSLGDVDSLIGLVRSQLDISLSGLLRD